MKKFIITYKGQKYELEVEEITGNDWGTKVISTAPAAPAPKESPSPVSAGSKTIKAPMPGKVLEVLVKPGDTVKRGAVVLILEAMKMRNEIMAPHDALIADVRISNGTTVSTGDVLVVLS